MVSEASLPVVQGPMTPVAQVASASVLAEAALALPVVQGPTAQVAQVASASVLAEAALAAVQRPMAVP